MDDVLSIRQQWEAQGGTILLAPSSLRYVEFQQRDVPNAQLAVRDRQVRKALAHAMDRQGIVDLQPPGVFQVAHFPLALNDPVYGPVDERVAKYEHDLDRAERLLDAAGWRRGENGVRRGTGSARLELSIWTTGGSEGEQGATVIADNWKRVGVDTAIHIVPPPLRSNAEYLTSFPAANYTATVTSYDELWWTTANAPDPARRYLGRNRGGYSHPEADRLAARVLLTIDAREREQILIELMRIWTDAVAILPVHYRAESLAAVKGVRGFESAIWPAQGPLPGIFMSG